MPLIRRCTICGKNREIVPGELVCYKCFPDLYRERLDNFKARLKKEETKEFEYLLKKFRLFQQ